MVQSVDDRAASTTDPVKNLTTGKMFTAEIEGPIDPFVVQSELGEDIREAVKLNVRNNAQAGAINRGDFVQFALFGAVTKHKIVKRVADAASPFTTFWAVKWTSADK